MVSMSTLRESLNRLTLSWTRPASAAATRLTRRGMARTLAEMTGHMHVTQCVERRPEKSVPVPLVLSDGGK
jgi:hypothetical protein